MCISVHDGEACKEHEEAQECELQAVRVWCCLKEAEQVVICAGMGGWC